jgi:hypothetical protein
MKTTIDMAREVKATAYTSRHYPDRTTYTFGPEQLKAFEALVRADERDRAMRENAYVQAEREACAKVCEEHQFASIGLAAAIRARGTHDPM